MTAASTISSLPSKTGEAFGWSFKDYVPDYCEFSDGRLTGGFAKSDSPKPGGPLVILYADDLAETQRRLEGVGVKIVNPLFTFPGGRRFHFEDPDGLVRQIAPARGGIDLPEIGADVRD